MNPKRRRAKVKLEAERILIDKGELAVKDLTSLIMDRVTYHLLPVQVGAILRNHSRITRRYSRGELASYLITPESERQGNLEGSPDGRG